MKNAFSSAESSCLYTWFESVYFVESVSFCFIVIPSSDAFDDFAEPESTISLSEVAIVASFGARNIFQEELSESNFCIVKYFSRFDLLPLKREEIVDATDLKVSFELPSITLRLPSAPVCMIESFVTTIVDGNGFVVCQTIPSSEKTNFPLDLRGRLILMFG